MSGRVPTDPLLLTTDLVKETLVTQCLHILTNIAGHMDVAATKEEIATPSLLGTRTTPKCRAGWTGAIMDAQNDSVSQYQG